ncbi:MAG: RDD family protein, partial [Actinobacteria bacterium]|nr:RDD family protein [Actinomycetota bacterium]
MADGVFIGLLTFTLGVATDRVSFVAGTLDTGLFVWAAAAQALYRWGMQSATGATLGKLLVGLRLVNRSGGPPGPLTVLAREGTLFVLVGLPSLLTVMGLQYVALLAQILSFYLIVR